MDRRGPTLGKSDAAAGRLLGEYTAAGAALKEYIWLDDTLVAILGAHAGTDHQYVLTDHLGTPRAVARPDTHAIVWRWNLSTTAFGDHAPLANPDGDAHTYTLNLRYPGQYFDAESGLHYNYFRDYDSATGRYLQSDPIGLASGMSTYAYVDSTPMSYSDPLGLEKWIWVSPIRDSVIFRGALADIDVPGVLTIYAHGGPNAMNGLSFFSQFGPVLDAAAVAEAIRLNPNVDRKLIWLESCRTGKELNGFAQQLADLTGLPVVAPTTQTWFTSRGPLGLWGKDRNGRRDATQPGRYITFVPRGN